MIPTKGMLDYRRAARYGALRAWFEYSLWSALWGFGVVSLLILIAKVYGG